MDKFFEALFGLLDNPATNLLVGLGIKQELAKLLVGVLAALLAWLAVVGLKWLQQRLKNDKTARDLKPEFDYLTIKKYRDIFIPTRYARISPNRYDNPNEAHKHNDPGKLIPFMIHKSFNERVENEKYYLVLADSGMGKTAFMVNLYMSYHSLFNFRKKGNQKMKLFRFQPPDLDNPVDIIERIKRIKDEDAKNMILLLDGLDEDPFILSKEAGISDETTFENRLNALAGQTRRFSDVVITCRTQYFPQEELQDYELNIRKPEGGFYKLNKYYLFPFSDAEVRQYLNKKYGRIRFWNRSKKRKALTLVNNSHKLMSRPMLMSYLDDLLIDDQKYEFSFQIYETLIEKWLIRESEKWKKNDERETFRSNLYSLAAETARHIYTNWQSQGVLYLAKDEAYQIAQSHQIDLSPDEVKGKSLLTCDPYLNWKFAHKSILEYFLAKQCAKDWPFAIEFNFNGMDMAQHFYREMSPFFNATHFVKVEGGRFNMGDEDGKLHDECRPVHQVKVASFYLGRTPVSQRLWQQTMNDNPSHFKNGDNWPVENVSWEEVQQFLERLSDQTGNSFRLPTEAEWEYAARGGNKSEGYLYSGSSSLDEVGWYNRNAGGKTHPVATRQPNELGLYDMSGNVWEWCSDWYGAEYYAECRQKGVVKDPPGPKNGSFRVLRGGSWINSAQICRSADRYGGHPGSRGSGVGFRLVFVPQFSSGLAGEQNPGGVEGDGGAE